MKIYFILIFTISMASSILGQNHNNPLNSSTYDSIKFNDVLKIRIEETNGIPLEMATLFGSSYIEEGGEEIGELWRKFKYRNGLCVYFSGLSNNQIPHITRIEANSITIKGNTVKIGEPISNLGFTFFISTSSTEKKIVTFTENDYDCCPIIIYLNPSDNTVTSIVYFVNT